MGKLRKKVEEVGKKLGKLMGKTVETLEEIWDNCRKIEKSWKSGKTKEELKNNF